MSKWPLIMAPGRDLQVILKCVGKPHLPFIIRSPHEIELTMFWKKNLMLFGFPECSEFGGNF